MSHGQTLSHSASSLDMGKMWTLSWKISTRHWFLKSLWKNVFRCRRNFYNIWTHGAGGIVMWRRACLEDRRSRKHYQQVRYPLTSGTPQRNDTLRNYCATCMLPPGQAVLDCPSEGDFHLRSWSTVNSRVMELNCTWGIFWDIIHIINSPF